MKIVLPTNTNHSFNLIPRYYNYNTLVLTLINEVTKVKTIVENVNLVSNGYMNLSFDFNFKEKDRYSFTLSENTDIIFRGKIYCTSENTQNYKQTKDVYKYEF